MTASGSRDAIAPRAAGPDFLCIGQRKAATTWLADQLKFHRDFWLPPIQELRYLYDRFRPYRQETSTLRISWKPWEIIKRVIRNRGPGIRADSEFYSRVAALSQRDELDLEGYARIFAPKRGRWSGDISPIYSCLDRDTIRRTTERFPEIKVILFARNPARRFWSDLSMYHRKGFLGDFDPTDPDELERFLSMPRIRCQAFLTEVVDRWKPYVRDDAFRMFFFDDVRDAPDRTFDEIVEFIGANPRHRIPVIGKGFDRKKGDRKLPMNPVAHRWLRETFRDEFEACAERFGGRALEWSNQLESDRNEV